MSTTTQSGATPRPPKPASTKPASAAFFDLDRTLLPSSSGSVFARHLRERGLGPQRDLPIGKLMGLSYDLFGENRPSMELARLAVRAAKGWSAETVAEAAEAAADELIDLIGGYVALVFAEHRAAGRLLVMATTTPEVLVGPLAKRLGMDAVVSTQWAVGDDGLFTGQLTGAFVWGRGKVNAVRAWAKANNVSLSHSYAYSDSFYDATLLAAVGHPVMVNPDPRLEIVGRLRKWPTRHLDVAPGVVKIAGKEIQQWLQKVNRPELLPFANFSFEGVENIPASGGAILVFNHRSYFDATAITLLLAKSGRAARFLGKKEVFDAPVVGSIAAALGGIRVVRASGSDEPLEAAAAALRAGELVSMAPQGTIPRGPAFFEPVLAGRWGAAKLAALTGAPVIPVGLWGTEKVWPRSARTPKIGTQRPDVSIRVGKPVVLKLKSPDADTKKIMSALVDLLPDEARERVTPTKEQLAATFPPGYKGDVTKEYSRRPGTDA